MRKSPWAARSRQISIMRGTVIEADDAGGAAQEFGRVQAGPADHVEDSLAGDVAEQVKVGRPRVVGVVEAMLSMAEKLISERVVLRLASNLVIHTAILPLSVRRIPRAAPDKYSITLTCRRQCARSGSPAGP